MKNINGLSSKDLEILKILIDHGYSSLKIAHFFGISVKSLKLHLKLMANDDDATKNQVSLDPEKPDTSQLQKAGYSINKGVVVSTPGSSQLNDELAKKHRYSSDENCIHRPLNKS